MKIDPESIRGFLDPAEGERLRALAQACARLGPCLEIGSYCGKSTVWIAAGCQAAGGTLFAIDHHRGSEEHQPGEAYHDPALYDAEWGVMDSLAEFRRTLRRAALEDVVVPIVAPSALVARHWSIRLGMVFIDGGHSREAAETDYRSWAPWVVPGGILAIHDIFPDPADGGRPPFEIYQRALASGLFEELPMTLTLGVLRRC
jgi:MMP 1-O-methyltransferase